MSTTERREQQWRETLEAAAILADRPESEPGDTPQPGELYLSRRTAGFPVEWLVLETAAGGRARVVPVDDYPLAGSHDVDLPPRGLGGAAVARCGLDTWAPREALEPQLRTAVLPRDLLRTVREKRTAVEEDRISPRLLEEVADGDPEYQDWMEDTVRPAVEALGESDARPWPPRIATLARRSAPVLALAALLVMALGLGTVVHRITGELEATRTRLAQLEEHGAEQSARLEEEARLRAVQEEEMGRLEEVLGSTRATLETTSERFESTRQQLRQALDLGAAVNLTKLVFGGGAVRNLPLTVSASDPNRLYFEVEVIDPEPYLTYRLRLRPIKNKGKPVTIDGLERYGAWLRLALSPDDLAVGEYEVLIDGMGFGDPAELTERYRLTVEP
jgi:hypothetical protein